MEAFAMLTSCRDVSESKIYEMRSIVRDIVQDKSIIVGLNGSYARREVTSGSDVDLFVLVQNETKLNYGAGILTSLKAAFKEKGFKCGADGGVFDEPLEIESLFKTIGGLEDKNIHITRRMLLLLEGDWLFNEELFDDARQILITKYVTDRIRDEQIALFLLNDIIRYWRTICVDFEHKVGNGKAMEIRLLKLRFSRMLLYVGGLVAVGMTHNMPAEKKRVELIKLFKTPPAERISNVMGRSVDRALEIYNEFLIAIDEPERRAVFETPRLQGDYSNEYEELRVKAKEFRAHLREALEATFSADHPLVAAILL